MVRMLPGIGLLAVALQLPVSAAAVPAPPAESVAARDLQMLSAIAGDVDGDRGRELVRVLRWGTNPTQLGVAVTSVGADGAASSWGQAPLRREAVPDDLDRPGVGPPDRQNMRALLTAEPARLIAWQLDGVEHVLVATIGTQGLARPCCLTLWEIGGSASSGVTLQLLGATHTSSRSVVAADMDGDGTDELVSIAPQDAQDPGIERITVFGWNGHEFRRVGDPVAVSAGIELREVGNVDGRPGAEAAGVDPRDPTTGQPALRVLRMADGHIFLGQLSLAAPGTPIGIQGADGPRLAVASNAGDTVLVDWMAGADALVATSPRRGVPLGVLGTGEEARLLLLRDDAFVDVLDATLTPRQGVFGGAAAAPFLGSPLPPYVGPLPGGLPGDDAAIIFRGRLVRAPNDTAGPGSFLGTQLIAALPGFTPVGLVGPAEGWIALAEGTDAAVDRRGGPLRAAAAQTTAGVAIVATADTLAPETDDGVLDPPVQGAVRVSGQPSRPLLVTREQANVSLDAPPGTRLSLERTRAVPGGAGSPPPDPMAARVDASGHLVVAILPPPGAASGSTFSTRLLAVTPAGHGYGAVWQIRVQRDPPTLRATAATTAFSLHVSISGTTDPGVAVSVDGVPVRVEADGTFGASVGGGLLPREVPVVATDPVGNTTRLTLSVVAVLDYRALPWIPIVALLTMLVGLVLYVRTPRTRSAAGGEGTLEEMD